MKFFVQTLAAVGLLLATSTAHAEDVVHFQEHIQGGNPDQPALVNIPDLPNDWEQAPTFKLKTPGRHRVNGIFCSAYHCGDFFPDTETFRFELAPAWSSMVIRSPSGSTALVWEASASMSRYGTTWVSK